MAKIGGERILMKLLWAGEEAYVEDGVRKIGGLAWRSASNIDLSNQTNKLHHQATQTKARAEEAGGEAGGEAPPGWRSRLPEKLVYGTSRCWKSMEGAPRKGRKGRLRAEHLKTELSARRRAFENWSANTRRMKGYREEK
jgi:hypothetical protein